MSPENRARIRDLYDAMNRRDVRALREFASGEDAMAAAR